MLNKSEVAMLLSDRVQIRHGQDDAASISYNYRTASVIVKERWLLGIMLTIAVLWFGVGVFATLSWQLAFPPI